MIKEYKYWDVGERWLGRPPNLGKTSLARIFKALIKCKGHLHDFCVFGGDDIPDHCRDIVYRISLPKGTKEKFEQLSGYYLTEPARISGL